MTFLNPRRVAARSFSLFQGCLFDPRGWSGAGWLPNFRRLVLGRMDSYDSDQRLILQGISRSTRLAFLCTAPPRGGDPLAWPATDRTWSFVCCYPVVVIWPPTLPPPSVVVGSLVSGILGGFLLLFSTGIPKPLHRSKLKFAIFRTSNFRDFVVTFCKFLLNSRSNPLFFTAIFTEFCRNCGKSQMIVKFVWILQNLGEMSEMFSENLQNLLKIGMQAGCL